MIHIAVGTGPIEAEAQMLALARIGRSSSPNDAGCSTSDVGGLANFIGIVRGDDGVESLELEHYPGATESALQATAEQAVERWSLLGVRIVHRVGILRPGDQIVFVGTAAAHRAAALDSCAFLIDRLKIDAPFWKKETRRSGSRWVAPRTSDAAAAARW